MGQPAQSPAGHQPGFGETVDLQQTVLRVGDLQEAWRHIAVEHQVVIDLVDDQPNAALAGESEQTALLLRGDYPAGRIARRIDENRRRPRAHLREQMI